MRGFVLGLLLLSGCTGAPTAPKAWHVEYALKAGEKLGGCAVGDVLPDKPGLELVAVGSSGKIYVCWREGDAWKSEVAFHAPGEMIQVACGEVTRPSGDPTEAAPGDEIVVVGMAKGRESSQGPGAAWLIRRKGSSWRARQIATSKRLLHGTCIAGGHIVVTGFMNTAEFLEPTKGDGLFLVRATYDLPGAGKNALYIDRALPAVLVACNDGTLVTLLTIAAGHNSKLEDGEGIIWDAGDKRSAGRARLGSDGTHVVVADDDGTLSISTPDFSILDGTKREEIHKESKKLRGAVLADLDTDHPGSEAACAGYENKITVLRKTKDGWQPEVVHEEPDRFHHLVAAELNGKPGMELVACGYAGALIVVSRR